MATIPIAEMTTKEVVQQTWRRGAALCLLSLSLVDMADEQLSAVRHSSSCIYQVKTKRLVRTVEFQLFSSCQWPVTGSAVCQSSRVCIIKLTSLPTAIAHSTAAQLRTQHTAENWRAPPI